MHGFHPPSTGVHLSEVHRYVSKNTTDVFSNAIIVNFLIDIVLRRIVCK